MKKNILKTIMLTTILVFAISSTVMAYLTYGYKLEGGIKNRTFSVPDNANYTWNGVTKDYGYYIRNGVQGWNQKINYISSSQPEDVYFTETTDKSSTAVDFYVGEWVDSGWRGLTWFYNQYGLKIEPDEANWNWCEIRLNVLDLHTSTTNEDVGTAAHEFGHALGLSHSNLTSGCVMMSGYVNRPTSPTTDDINGVRSIY